MKRFLRAGLCLLMAAVLVMTAAGCKKNKSKSEEWGIIPENYKTETTSVRAEIAAEEIRYYLTTTPYDFSVFKQDGKYGLIGFDGAVLHAAEYTMIEPWEKQPDGEETALLATAADGSRYWLDADGTPQPATAVPDHVPVDRPSVFWDVNEQKAILFVPDRGVIDCTYENYNDAFHGIWCLGSYTATAPRKIAVQSVKSFLCTDDGEGHYSYSAVKSTDHYGIYDFDTDTVCTEFVYSLCNPIGFVDGILPVCAGGLWSYMTADYKLICDYLLETCHINDGGAHEVYSVVNGYAVIYKEGLYGLLSNKGEWATEMKYVDISQVNPDGYFWAKELDSEVWELMKIREK